MYNLEVDIALLRFELGLLAAFPLHSIDILLRCKIAHKNILRIEHKPHFLLQMVLLVLHEI